MQRRPCIQNPLSFRRSERHVSGDLGCSLVRSESMVCQLVQYSNQSLVEHLERGREISRVEVRSHLQVLFGSQIVPFGRGHHRLGSLIVPVDPLPEAKHSAGKGLWSTA